MGKLQTPRAPPNRTAQDALKITHVSSNMCGVVVATIPDSSLIVGWCGVAIAVWLVVTGIRMAASRAAALMAAAGGLAIPLTLAAPAGAQLAVFLTVPLLIGVIAGSLGPIRRGHIAMVTVGSLVAVLWIRQLVAAPWDTDPGDFFVPVVMALNVIQGMFLALVVLIGCTGGELVRRRGLSR